MDQRERRSILEDLGSPDDEVRRLAVDRIGWLSSDEAVPRLIERLADESWRVRKSAIERLAGVADPERTVSSLIECLSDGDDSGRRNAALEALVRCGPAAVPTLLAASGAPDADVRKQLVDALAGIADRSSTRRLMELLDDPDANVRGAAADALGAVGDPDAGDALARAAGEDGERLVRLSALRALERLGASLPLSVLEPLLADAILRPAALLLLGHSGEEEALEQLLKGLGCGSQRGREAAMAAILRVASQVDESGMRALLERVREAADGDPELVAAALSRLASADLPDRLMLVQFLALLGRSETVVPLLHAGTDEALSQVVLATLDGIDGVASVIDEAWDELEVPARTLACEVIGRSQDAAGTGRLLEALVARAPELRTAAARALGRRGCRAAVPRLVERLERLSTAPEALEDDEREAVIQALVAVAGSDSEAADETARRLDARLPEGSEGMREAAARILGRLGRAEDALRLRRLLCDASPTVRRAGVIALSRLRSGVRDESVRLALADESFRVRTAAASALSNSRHGRAFRDLACLAADEDPRVRAAVMRAVGVRARLFGADADVVEILERGLTDQAPVAIAAVEALREAGGAPAAERVLPLLQHDVPELVQAAVACLRDHAEPSRLDALFPLVSHPHWSVRAETIQALSDRGSTRAIPAILRRLETEQDEFVRATILRALQRLEG